MAKKSTAMLAPHVRAQREEFYRGVFGEEKFLAIVLLRPYLWDVSMYLEKVAGLSARGFSDPQKMIGSFPAILHYSFGNIDEKIAGLSARGFSDPQKMIGSLPTILGLSFENIDAKIEGLRERGFSNPQKMITSLPAILGLSFENIDRKLKLCRRLNVDVTTFIAYSVVFIGMSAKHYVQIARRCRDLNIDPTPKNVFRIYKKKTF